MLELKNQKLLVIAPHPDDEVIGCGGLIAKTKEEGGKVFVLFLTVGDTKDYSKLGLSTGKARIAEIEKVAKFLKYDNWHIAFEGDQYHLKLDTLPQFELIAAIERDTPVSIDKVKPTIILFPQITSYNQDHRMAAAAAFTACRPASTKFKFQPTIILSYEEAADFWSQEKLQVPNFFVQLTKGQFEKKLKALKLYKSQLRKNVNPRSLEVLGNLAQLRGTHATTNYAEAFYCHKIIT